MFCTKFWKKSLDPMPLDFQDQALPVPFGKVAVFSKSQILRSTYFMSSIALGTFIYLFPLKTSVFYILIY